MCIVINARPPAWRVRSAWKSSPCSRYPASSDSIFLSSSVGSDTSIRPAAERLIS
uniref:Uncharacterized protein n=1 Tax=Yersinia enterocolitica TaxID=630 RepID=B0RL56_YEREN|nr:hypothetical protein [Yersinia enterocolitica]